MLPSLSLSLNCHRLSGGEEWSHLYGARRWFTQNIKVVDHLVRNGMKGAGNRSQRTLKRAIQ